MTDSSRKNRLFRNTVFAVATLAVACPLAISTASAAQRAPLTITNDPLPPGLREQVYSRPAKVRDIKSGELVDQNYNTSLSGESTVVGAKINELSGELHGLQGKISSLSTSLSSMQRDNEAKAAEYYAAVATVNTQLQAGTTPGNPRLVKKLSAAEANLENLSLTIASLNQLGIDIAHVASEASYLLEATRAAYSLSGAVEEDHVQLAELEDAVNGTEVVIERLLNNVNDDITRTSTYLSSERNNLRALSLAVSNGDLYGKSLANRPFSNVGAFIPASTSSADVLGASGAASASPAVLSGQRVLVKIRFDRPDVNFEQPVYMAVNEALERYPNARLDLVAVHPTKGNAAEVAIESTKARRNAERVLRTLTQMGLPLSRIDLSYSDSAEAATNEVHLYVRQ